MRLLVVCSLLAVLLLPLGGCESNRNILDSEPPTDLAGTDQPAPTYALELSPADATLNVSGSSPASLTYRVLRRGQDVTSQATLTVDDGRIGSFSGGVLNIASGAAGKTNLRARLGDDEGATTLTVRVTVVVIAPGTPSDAPGKFGGSADPSLAPEIAYPPAGALVPPNLNELEVHFRPGRADLFEVRFLGDAIDLRIYTACKKIEGGCALLPDEASWKWLSQAAHGGTLKLSMRGSSGGSVGTSKAQDLSFTSEDLKGGLYYWAASLGGIARYDFGLRGQKAESYYGPLQAIGLCVGCHAISGNGKRTAVGMNIPGPAVMRALDTATRTKLFEVGVGIGIGSNYQAFTYDGSYLVTTETGGLTVRDGTTGAIKGANPAVANANMPDIAANSKSVVFARNPTPQCIGPICETLSVLGASLFTVAFLPDQTFGTPLLLAPADGMNNYYPSFSPDSRFVVYNRAAGDSYNAADAKVMVIAASGGGKPIDLTSVNDSVGNSWPKWSPFVHHFQRRTILWLTYSSLRPFGLRNTPAAQIWMVPVDLAKLEAGQDSGYPPFRLPFQDLATGNHIAQWVASVERAPCTPGEMSGCSADEQCRDGYCTPVIK